MSGVKAKGIFIKGVKITRVDPSELPPPPDVLATSLTATVKQPFEGTKAPGMFAARGLPTARPPAPAPASAPLPKPTGRTFKLKPSVAPPIFEDEEEEEDLLPTIVPPELSAYQEAIDADEATSTYAESDPAPYIPQDNKKFFTFIKSRYAQFELPQLLGQKINQ